MWLLCPVSLIKCSLLKGRGNPNSNNCTEISMQPQNVPNWLQELKPSMPITQEGKPPTPLVQGGKPPTPLVQGGKPPFLTKENNQNPFGDILEKPSSRPSSGRTSGLRGQLLSQQSMLSQQGHSYSEGDLLSCSEQCHPRLKTAVRLLCVCVCVCVLVCDI